MSLIHDLSLDFRQLLGGTVKQKIFFLHIPKCGGSSIHRAIRRSFGPIETYMKRSRFGLEVEPSLKAADLTGEEMMKYNEKLLLYFMASDRYRYISGHFAYSRIAFEKFGEEWKFVTILRNPVSKWFSQYFYNRHKNYPSFRIDSSLDEFLESDVGIALGSDYVRKLTDNPVIKDFTSQEAINEAVGNVSRFPLTGVLERTDLFARDFQGIFGAPLYIEKVNKSPVAIAKQQEIITDQHRKRVAEICAPDIQVYNAVMQRVPG